MKKIWIFLLICGINFSAFGQVVSNYAIVLNNDTSPLNVTLENKKIICSFKVTDVLTISFKELKLDMTKKSVEIKSDSKTNEIVIGTFNKTDIRDDKSYVLNVSFSNLKLNSGTNEIYTLIISDEKGQQNLLRFKLFN